MGIAPLYHLVSAVTNQKKKKWSNKFISQYQSLTKGIGYQESAKVEKPEL